MKVGDIVYCKKNYGYENNYIYRKGNYYKISNIVIEDDDEIWVSLNFSNFLFNISKKIETGSASNYFYRYFDDNKEIRKRKLEKLKYEGG